MLLKYRTKYLNASNQEKKQTTNYYQGKHHPTI